MEKRKKILSLMLSALMVAGLLAGCGNSAAPAEESTKESAEKSEEETAEEVLKGGGSNIIYVITASFTRKIHVITIPVNTFYIFILYNNRKH